MTTNNQRTKNTRTLSCPSCGSAELRADIHQSCLLELSDEGNITDCYDFSEPEVDRDAFFCEACGARLVVQYSANGKSARLEERSVRNERDEPTP